jgi:Xaa-Pro aminopeptidase
MAQDRLQALRTLWEQRLPRAEALLITGEANRRYLSGFRGDAGWLWITRTDAALLTDSRFWEQAAQECPDWRLVRVENAGNEEFVAQEAAAAGITRLAVEPAHLTWATYRGLRRRLRGMHLLAAPDLVEQLRAVKEARELDAIRRAAAIADQALAAWIPLVRPGATEATLAFELEVRLRQLGSDGVAFPTIVATGAHGAMAHAIPGPTELQAGDVLVVDFGAVVDGYRSDMTRTLFVPGAPPPPEARQVVDVVAQAVAAGLAALRPGARCLAVDAAARDTIAAAGYGDRFGHGLGHAVGLEIHEGPAFGPRAKPRTRVPAGAVVTIEPGIYLPGRFGVRLEQLVAVHADGTELLSRAPLLPEALEGLSG